jgi:hypothetical protein
MASIELRLTSEHAAKFLILVDQYTEHGSDTEAHALAQWLADMRNNSDQSPGTLYANAYTLDALPRPYDQDARDRAEPEIIRFLCNYGND